MKEVLDFLGDSTGINVAYDKDFQPTTPITVNIDGVTLEEALQQILTVNGAYYKVLNPRSILVIADSAAKRNVYDEQAIRIFYLSSADAGEIEQLLTKLVTTQTTGVRPTFAANKNANSITVRGTIPMLQMVERVIAMNDKPRAEISVDVEILEVNRGNAKQYGLDLSSYQVGRGVLAGRQARHRDGTSTFNLNTISAGVSTADFYAAVPSAVIRFLEQDSETKVIAKPNLRGAEGEKLSLKLGEELPVPSTTFYNPYGGQGSVATAPLTSFTYRNVGVNLDIEPRVTYDGDIILKVALEISAKGPDQNVAGQNLPTFFSRKVETRLRLRDGESNLLAGLLRENERKTLKGVPGISSIPILRDLFAVERQGNRPDRHRHAAHAAHCAGALADDEGLCAAVCRHPGQSRIGGPAAADSGSWPGRGSRGGRPHGPRLRARLPRRRPRSLSRRRPPRPQRRRLLAPQVAPAQVPAVPQTTPAQPGRVPARGGRRAGAAR